MSYNAQELIERRGISVEEAVGLVAPGRVTWIDCRGLGDGAMVQALGERLGLHPLALSDVVNTGQRPKVEAYDDQLFLIVRMVMLNPEKDLEWDQLSIFLGKHFVVSFQETPPDCLDAVRERIRSPRKPRSQIRSLGADYLACMLVDATVDGYFPVLEHYGERIESLEEHLFAARSQDVLGSLYRTRRDLTAFRRAVLPLREALLHLQRDPESTIGTRARLHVRDTLDHTAQVLDLNDDYSDLTAQLVEMHLSLTARKTNEVIRVLTLVTAIFIPLTFIAGVYGMNFDRSHPGNMPELGWPHGYAFFWGLCLVTTVALVAIFFRLGWLRR
jgi:magnesium transporter